MMKIEIPQSLYDILLERCGSYYTTSLKAGTHGNIIMRGPYGDYKIVSKPDDTYCEKVNKIVLQYKD